MASAFSHAFVAVALGKLAQRHIMTWRVLLLGAVCSIVPDLDVIGLYYGVPYGDLWGHRGLTHSFFFAALLSSVLVVVWPRQTPAQARAGLLLYLFLCTASHGVLDAMTDGGLGVAFFSPFNNTRYFFAVRPVVVSPIGVGEFFGQEALHILASEAKWIWFPTFAVLLILRALQRIWVGQPAMDRSRAD